MVEQIEGPPLTLSVKYILFLEIRCLDVYQYGCSKGILIALQCNQFRNTKFSVPQTSTQAKRTIWTAIVTHLNLPDSFIYCSVPEHLMAVVIRFILIGYGKPLALKALNF